MISKTPREKRMRFRSLRHPKRRTVTAIVAIGLTLSFYDATATANTEAAAPQSWGLDRIDQATNQLDNNYIFPVSSGAGVRVYVLDTGVEGSLMSFGGRVEKGFDATTGLGGRADTDCNGHGTHVAGTIASSQFGVAPRATIVPVKVATCVGGISSAWIYKGLEWVIANHPKGTPGVVNMSIAVSYNEAINNLADKLYRHGLVTVAAAGNYSNRVDACRLSPSSTKSTLTVGSIDSNGFMTRVSNFNNCIDLYAPGGSIVSEDTKRPSFARTGTSMAAAHVSGAAALYLGLHASQGASMFTHLVVRHASVGTIQNLLSGENRVLDITFINNLAVGNQTPAPPSTAEESAGSAGVSPVEQSEDVQTIATAPRNLLVMTGATVMVFVWDPPFNYDRVKLKYYQLEYSYDRGRSWRALTRAPSASTTIQSPKPPVGQLASFRIIGITDAGAGEPSEVVTTRIGR